LLGLKEGVNCASIVVGESSGKMAQIFFSLLMAVSTPVIFQGLLEFVIMIRNPFGKDWVDLPTQLIHQQLRDEMFQYTGAGEGAAAIPTVKAAKLK
jgi:predicted membrane chloride channel (bestrophin family)